MTGVQTCALPICFPVTIGPGKIIPILVTIVIGYFVFVKLPFLFFRRTLRDVRREREQMDENLPKFPEEPKVMKLEEKIKRDAEELKKEQQKFHQQQKKEQKTEQKTEQKKEGPRKEQKQDRREPPPKQPAAEAAPTPESVFELKPGEKFTQDQLKAKHRELIKQSHPDKVASMGPDFRKLAEKKTKEINEAYEKLKKKAS